MTTLALLGTTLGFAFSAGLNLYATVLVIGGALRLGWVTLPAGYDSLGLLADPLVLGVAAVMYAVEFVADKVPAVDHLWDAIHSVIRPLGAIWIAWRTIGGAGLPEPVEVAFLIAAGGVALTTHAGKAGTRVATASVGGHFMGLGIVFSLIEDVLAFVMTALALVVPLLILGVVLFAVVALALVIRSVRRRRRPVPL